MSLPGGNLPSSSFVLRLSTGKGNLFCSMNSLAWLWSRRTHRHTHTKKPQGGSSDKTVSATPLASGRKRGEAARFWKLRRLSFMGRVGGIFFSHAAFLSSGKLLWYTSLSGVTEVGRVKPGETHQDLLSVEREDRLAGRTASFLTVRVLQLQNR